MRRLPSLDVMARGLRQNICTQCRFRPPGSEQLGPDEPRSCEPECPIFFNLATLQQIESTVHANTTQPYERAARELICQHCERNPDTGDFCVDRTQQRCPLTMYFAEVIDTLERVEAAVTHP